MSHTNIKMRSYVVHPDFKPGPPVGPRTLTAGPWKVADLCKAYGIPKNLPGGGKIGILEFGGNWSQSDLDKFSQINGIPKITVKDVSVDGSTNNGTDEPDAAVEVLLDIQVAAGVYYNATGKMPEITVYWMGNSIDGFADVVTKAAQDGCSVLSISWGTSESGVPSQYANALESVVQQAAKLGMVVTAASGDNSAGDNAPGGAMTPDFPSCCPSIIGCGGTNKTSIAEVVWGNGQANGSGTGGGYSKLFQRPAYQKPTPNDRLGRMVPDIAAVADPQTGYRIVVNGQEIVVGGTSAVAPFYAGFFAACGAKIGPVLALLWGHPEAFSDVRQGSNGYPAQVGPDPCTGLGVLIGGVLSGLLNNSNPVPPVPVPTTTQPIPVPPPTDGFTGVVTEVYVSGKLMQHTAKQINQAGSINTRLTQDQINELLDILRNALLFFFGGSQSATNRPK